MTYNHKEATQPQIFTYSNLGPRWTFDQLSFIEDERSRERHSPRARRRRGGLRGLRRAGLRPALQEPDRRRRASQPIRSSGRCVTPTARSTSTRSPTASVCSGRRVFMTESRDPRGTPSSYTYDENLRLVAITDALGQVTTISYELASDPWKITRVTDPFGRSAQFDYDTPGKLVRITDVIGLTSEFEYASSEQALADFITALTTPYGTTTFSQTSRSRRQVVELEATDPLGGTERIAYDKDDSIVPADQRQRHPGRPGPRPDGIRGGQHRPQRGPHPLLEQAGDGPSSRRLSQGEGDPLVPDLSSRAGAAQLRT